MRLFIADADKQLRVALQILLHQQTGLHVTGMATEARGLLAQVEASQPDVLLIDWNLPGRPMADLLADLQAFVPSPEIVVLSVRPEDKSAALTAGADAFVEKSSAPEKLLEHLSTISKPKHVK
jgi:DNA-binding NarL/FixJ family response regulator